MPSEIEIAEWRDKTLRLFAGNEQVRKSDLLSKYKEEEYFMFENSLNYLEGENYLKKLGEHDIYYQMTPKGFALYTNLDIEGFVARQEKSNSLVKQETCRFKINLTIQILIAVLAIIGIMVSAKSCSAT